MKTLNIILLGFLFITLGELNTLRHYFQEANSSYQNAEKFYSEVNNIGNCNKTHLVDAYNGAASIIISKFEKDRAKKKALITEGINKLENCIRENPMEVELRFIRLIIQENLPKFIKYNQNINEDKDLILTTYNAQDTFLKVWIKEYAQVSKNFSEEELGLFL